MTIKVQPLKSNKLGSLGVLIYYAKLKKRLRKCHIGYCIVESVPQAMGRLGFRADKTCGRIVSAGYECATVMVKRVHGQLVRIATLNY